MAVVLAIIVVAISHFVETASGFGATILALSLGIHLVELETLVVALRRVRS